MSIYSCIFYLDKDNPQNSSHITSAMDSTSLKFYDAFLLFSTEANYFMSYFFVKYIYLIQGITSCIQAIIDEEQEETKSTSNGSETSKEKGDSDFQGIIIIEL